MHWMATARTIDNIMHHACAHTTLYQSQNLKNQTILNSIFNTYTHTHTPCTAVCNWNFNRMHCTKVEHFFRNSQFQNSKFPNDCSNNVTNLCIFGCGDLEVSLLVEWALSQSIRGMFEEHILHEYIYSVNTRNVILRFWCTMDARKMNMRITPEMEFVYVRAKGIERDTQWDG